MKKQIYSALLLMLSVSALAQQKISDSGTPSAPNASAILELETSTRGQLPARIALSSTTVAAPVTSPANALTVFNTATAGDVTPGYYYWSAADTKWIRMNTPEPWYNVATNAGATANTQDIYQMGNVGIGTPAPTDAYLQVNRLADLPEKAQFRMARAGLSVGTIGVTPGTRHGIFISRYNDENSNDGSPVVSMTRARGSDGAAPIPLLAGDQLGMILGQGSVGAGSGSLYRLGSAIYFNAENDWNPTDAKGNISFLTLNTPGTTVPTEKMRLSSQGYLGIGTTTPGRPLEIVRQNSGAFNSGIQMYEFNDGASVSSGAQIHTVYAKGTQAAPASLNNGDAIGAYNFGYYAGGAYTAGNGSKIMSFYRGDGTNFRNDIHFYTTGASGTALTKMTIDPDGNVGIGIASPSAKIHVIKAAADLTPAIIVGCPVFADNAAAIAGGLPVGGIYRTATGVLMVVF